MVEQIKNVNWLGYHAIFEHDQFFDYMWHWPKWSKKHKNCNNDQNPVWYFIKKSHYDLLVLAY